jgi:hypothetical protein
MIFTLDPIDGRHIEVNQSDLTHYRELSADEAEQWANGWATFPLAVETDHGVLVPDQTWHTHDTAPLPNGRDGADDVISDAWSVRFCRYAHDDGWLVVDVEASVVTRDEDTDAPRDERTGAVLDADGDPVMWVQGRLHYVVCLDPADPGGTERWSSVEYAEEGPWLVASADLDRECQRYLGEWLRHGALWIDWDGQRF